MEITRNVILDLLPLYLANEVSADTREIIEQYLETDPELANVVKHSAAAKFPEEIPGPQTQNDQIKAFRKAKWLFVLLAAVLAGVITIFLVIVIFIFFFSSSP